LTHPLRALVAAVALAAAAGSLAACQPPGPRVLVFGDSLTVEAKGSGDAAHVLAGYSVDWSGVKYMTAPCNGLAVAKAIRYVPDVVIVNYAGNRGSFQDNCMDGETGQALADRYVTDVTALIERFRNGHTKVVIVGAPARKATLADGNLVFDALRDLAATPAQRVGFFDGGRFLTPDRTVVPRTATCLSPRETEGGHCGSSSPGRNVIRDAALEHLCPTGGTIGGTCGTYSSGAVRLALNLRDAIKVARVPAPKPT
jgi:hypothetical protein